MQDFKSNKGPAASAGDVRPEDGERRVFDRGDIVRSTLFSYLARQRHRSYLEIGESLFQKCKEHF